MNDLTSPPVSIVMSVYNGEKYLRDAIDSILYQTLENFEYIIVDGGSTDNSKEIIKSYNDPRVVFIEQRNASLATSLNRGIKSARGKYIARMDADDISIPQRLQKQFDFMENNSEYVAVGSNAIVIEMNGSEIYTSNQPITWEDIQKILALQKSPFFHSSTFFRKDVSLKFGCYNEGLKNYYEDLLFFILMSKYGKFFNLEEPLIKYRLGIHSGGNRTKKSIIMNKKIILSYLENMEFSEKDRKYLEILNNSRLSTSKFFKISNYHLRIGKIFIEECFNRKKALYNLFLSIIYRPLNYIALFNLFLTLMPKLLIRKWKHHRGIDIR